MGGLRGSVRLMSFVRIAILARILTPEQFGLFAIASLVLSFLEILTETGVNVFLIQEKEDIEKYIDTAWVVSIARGLFIALLIFLVSPYIAGFFNTPESLYYLRLISLVPLIRGFINPAIAKFRKDLEFNKEFYFRSSLFFVDTFFAILISFFTGSSIGLIWGVIIGATLEVIISMRFIKPRPKFIYEPEKTKKVIHKGKYVTAAGIFNYLAQEGDDWAVGRMLGSTDLGLYQAAYKISSLPLTEITQVAGKVTFPVYTKIADDGKRLKSAFTKTSLSLIAIIIPFGLFIFFFPELVIRIILGDQWLAATEVLRVLAIFGIIRASVGLAHALFLALNKQNYVAVITLTQFVVLAILIIPAINIYGLVGAGYATVVAVLASIPFVGYYLSKVFKNEKK